MKIYTGSAAGPLTVLGKHQTRLALFALQNQGWHSYAGDRATLRALAGLQRLKVIEVAAGSKQFMWNDSRTASDKR